MKFTPEQLATFAAAGWNPDQIKEMLEYDTEVQGKIEKGDSIKPEDVGNHIDDPKPEDDKKAEDKVTAENVLENLLGGN